MIAWTVHGKLMYLIMVKIVKLSLRGSYVTRTVIKLLLISVWVTNGMCSTG